MRRPAGVPHAIRALIDRFVRCRKGSSAFNGYSYAFHYSRTIPDSLGESVPYRLAQRGRPLAGACQQAADLVGVARQEGLGEPDAAGGQSADGVERPGAADLVLLACGEHGLVSAEI